MTTNFPWDESRLVAPPTIHHLSIGDRSILFCEARQLIYGLNSTADRIWQMLADGGVPAEARRQLTDLGVSADEARAFVEDAMRSWLQGGQLAPQEALARLRQPADATRALRIDELSVRFNCCGVAPDQADTVFGQFAAADKQANLKLSIVSCRDQVFLFEGDRPLGSCGAHEWIPRLKAVLTEH